MTMYTPLAAATIVGIGILFIYWFIQTCRLEEKRKQREKEKEKWR